MDLSLQHEDNVDKEAGQQQACRHVLSRLGGLEEAATLPP